MSREPIDVEILRSELASRWSRVDVVAETASTNADLLNRLDVPDRAALIAETQTAGRGRFDRVWTSPARAGLTLSFALRPAVPLVGWGWLTLLTGVALAEAVQDVAGLDTALKWPNDLMLGAAKCAGILAQTTGEGDVVVIGIGLNVSTTREELPVPTATSLALHGARDLDRTALAVAILRRVDARVAQWSDVGGDAEACGLAAAYRERSATIGARVRVSEADGGVREGVTLDVDADGRLLLDVDGIPHTVAAGDVEHVRPA